MQPLQAGYIHIRWSKVSEYKANCAAASVYQHRWHISTMRGCVMTCYKMQFKITGIFFYIKKSYLYEDIILHFKCNIL